MGLDSQPDIRRFARCYSEAEHEELLVLRRPDGLPLHRGHVIYRITIDHKPDRKRIQKRVAKEGWSAPKLYSVLQEEFADGEGRGGRPVKVPPSAEGKLQFMIEETERRLRHWEAVCGNDGQNWVDARNEADKESVKVLARTLSASLKRMAQISDKMSGELNRVRRSKIRRGYRVFGFLRICPQHTSWQGLMGSNDPSLGSRHLPI